MHDCLPPVIQVTSPGKLSLMLGLKLPPSHMLSWLLTSRYLLVYFLGLSPLIGL